MALHYRAKWTNAIYCKTLRSAWGSNFLQLHFVRLQRVTRGEKRLPHRQHWILKLDNGPDREKMDGLLA